MIDIIVGLIGGFGISILTFIISRRITRKAERVEMLREHIRKFFPALKEMGDDLSYFIALKRHLWYNSASILEMGVRAINLTYRLKWGMI